jgi:hypothetical protein
MRLRRNPTETFELVRRSTGNSLESHSSESDALSAYASYATDSPDMAEDLMIIAFNAEGEATRTLGQAEALQEELRRQVEEGATSGGSIPRISSVHARDSSREGERR